MTRRTHQKETVLQIMREWNGHPTAEQVYRQVKEQLPTIGRATVFRILGQYVEQKVLHRVQNPGKADCFDCTLQPHYHVRCTGCGRVDDVHMPVQDAFCPSERAAGYLVTGHDLVFYGICPECQAQEGCGDDPLQLDSEGA